MENVFEKIEWKPEYDLGIEEIDEQHQYLVALIGKLYDLIAYDSANYNAKVKPILEELVDYTEYHFKREESEYFRKYNYSNSNIHVMQHDNFIHEVQHKIKGVEKSTVEDGKGLYNYLMSWLLSHIAKADRAWASFVVPQLSK